MLFQNKLLKDKNVNTYTKKVPINAYVENIGDYQKLPYSSCPFKQIFFERMKEYEQ